MGLISDLPSSNGESNQRLLWPTVLDQQTRHLCGFLTLKMRVLPPCVQSKGL